MRHILLAVLLCASRLSHAACAGGTDSENLFDNSLAAVCGAAASQVGTITYTTSNAPSPNTYWAVVDSSNHPYNNGGTTLSSTTGSVEYVFRTGSDVTTSQFVSSAIATGTGSYRWMDIYIIGGALYFYNATPSLAGTISAVSANTTYWIGINWDSTSTRFWIGTTSTNMTQVLTSGVLSTSPAIQGFTLGYSAALGLPMSAGNFAQFRMSSVTRSSFPTVDGGPTATPTPNWTATVTPTITQTATITPTFVACGNKVRIGQWGDSFQQANGCANLEMGEVGLRPWLINDLTYLYGQPSYLVGQFPYGSDPLCPYSNAVSGQPTGTMLTSVITNVPIYFANPTANDVILLGGGTAGEITGETSAQIQANWSAMMDFINGYSSKIHIVLINPAWNPTYSYATTYNAWVGALAYGRSKGYNVVPYNSVTTLGMDTANVCPDNLHPTLSAQVAMGHDLARVVYLALTGTAPLAPYVQNIRNTWMTPLAYPWP